MCKVFPVLKQVTTDPININLKTEHVKCPYPPLPWIGVPGGEAKTGGEVKTEPGVTQNTEYRG